MTNERKPTTERNAEHVLLQVERDGVWRDLLIVRSSESEMRVRRIAAATGCRARTVPLAPSPPVVTAAA